jgi:hypothetical protein
MEGSFRVEYYNLRVRKDIEDWPRADSKCVTGALAGAVSMG